MYKYVRVDMCMGFQILIIDAKFGTSVLEFLFGEIKFFLEKSKLFQLFLCTQHEQILEAASAHH